MGWEGAADIYDPIGLNISCFCAHLHLLVSISARLSLNEPPPLSLRFASPRLASPRLVSSHLVTPFPALSPIIFLRMLSLPRFSPPLFPSVLVFFCLALYRSLLFFSVRLVSFRIWPFAANHLKECFDLDRDATPIPRSFDRVEDLFEPSGNLAFRCYATKEILQQDGWM